VALLAYRFARERLRAAARAEGLRDRSVPSVLFVCTHNAGRSQLAAALLTHLGGDRIEVASAGSQHAEKVAPEVVNTLAEIDLETTALFPKPVTDEVIRGADVVITMGCGDSCPVVPGRRYLDWNVADPEGADTETLRRIRDEIASRVYLLASELGVLTQPGGADQTPARTGG
jgi:arsenate reductase